MFNNIIKCNECNATLIQEELEIHKCYNPSKKRFFFDTDNDFVEVFDGERWIKIKSKTYQPKGNTEKSTDDETESKGKRS